jgi:hypothetical protein
MVNVGKYKQGERKNNSKTNIRMRERLSRRFLFMFFPHWWVHHVFSIFFSLKRFLFMFLDVVLGAS